MSQRILVIGGAGFIGASLSAHLIENSHEVFIYDNFTNFLDPEKSKYKLHQKARLDMLAGEAQIIRGDIRNYDLLHKVLKEHQPETVVHLASIPIASVSNKLTNDALDININGLIAIIRAIGAVDCVKRVVYSSSSYVYGNFQYDPADEKHPTNPMDVYGGTKLAGENIIKGFATRFDIEYVIIRPSAVYGPTDANFRVSQIFVENALSGEPLVLKGPQQSLDFTYVLDTVQGFSLAITKSEAKNEIFNITFGKARTLKEFTEILEGHISDIQVIAREVDKYVPRRGTLDISKARSQLGYNPQYPLEKGIEKYINHLRAL